MEILFLVYFIGCFLLFKQGIDFYRAAYTDMGSATRRRISREKASGRWKDALRLDTSRALRALGIERAATAGLHMALGVLLFYRETLEQCIANEFHILLYFGVLFGHICVGGYRSSKIAQIKDDE